MKALRKIFLAMALLLSITSLSQAAGNPWDNDTEHDWVVMAGNLHLQSQLTGGAVQGGIWPFLKNYQIDFRKVTSLPEMMIFSGRGSAGAQQGNALAERKGFFGLNLQAQTNQDPVAFFGINLSGDIPVEEKVISSMATVKDVVFMDFPRGGLSVEVFYSTTNNKVALCKFKFKGYTFYLLEDASRGISGLGELLAQIKNPGPVIGEATGFAVPEFFYKKKGVIPWMAGVLVEGSPLVFKEEVEIKFQPELTWKSGSSSVSPKNVGLRDDSEEGLQGRWVIEHPFAVCVGIGEGSNFVPISYFFAERDLWKTRPTRH